MGLSSGKEAIDGIAKRTETASFSELASQFVGFQQTRTKSGWELDQAVQRSSVRSRLTNMSSQSAGFDADDSLELQCPVELVDLASKKTRSSTLQSLCRGGCVLSPIAIEPGAAVELRFGAHRVRGQVVTKSCTELHLSLADDERRIGRLLDELAKWARSEGF